MKLQLLCVLGLISKIASKYQYKPIHRPFFAAPGFESDRYPRSYKPDFNLIRFAKNGIRKSNHTRRSHSHLTRHKQHPPPEHPKPPSQLCRSDKDCHSKWFHCVHSSTANTCQRRDIDPVSKSTLLPIILLVFLSLLGSVQSMLNAPVLVAFVSHSLGLLGRDIEYLLVVLELMVVLPSIVFILAQIHLNRHLNSPPPIHLNLVFVLLPVVFLGKYFAHRSSAFLYSLASAQAQWSLTMLSSVALIAFILLKMLPIESWKPTPAEVPSKQTKRVLYTDSTLYPKRPCLGIQFNGAQSTLREIKQFDDAFGNGHDRINTMSVRPVDERLREIRTSTSKKRSEQLSHPSEFEGLSFLRVNMQARLSKEQIYRKYNLSDHRRGAALPQKSIADIDRDIWQVNMSQKNSSRFGVDRLLELDSQRLTMDRPVSDFDPEKVLGPDALLLTPKTNKNQSQAHSGSHSLKNYSEVCKPKYKHRRRNFEEAYRPLCATNQMLKHTLSNQAQLCRRPYASGLTPEGERIDSRHAIQSVAVSHFNPERQGSKTKRGPRARNQDSRRDEHDQKENRRHMNVQPKHLDNDSKLNISKILKTQQFQTQHEHSIESLKLDIDGLKQTPAERILRETLDHQHNGVDSKSTKKMCFRAIHCDEGASGMRSPNAQTLFNWNHSTGSQRRPKPSAPSEKVSTRVYQLQVEYYNYFKRQQHSIFTWFHFKLLAGSLGFVGLLILLDLFCSDYFQNNVFFPKSLFRLILASQGFVYSMWLYFKLRQRQFKAEDCNVSTDKLSQVSFLRLLPVLLGCFAAPFLAKVSAMQADYVLFVLMFALSPDVYRNALSLSILNLFSGAFFLLAGRTAFWSRNVYFLCIVGGLTLFYGLFLRVIYGMSFRLHMWRKAIVLFTLISLFLGLLLTLCLSPSSLNLFFVDKIVYKNKWAHSLSF